MYHLIIDTRWPTITHKYNLIKPLTKFSRCISQSPFSRMSVPQTEKVVFSAIQPTGIPHLGNYLGAMINWVKLQESENCDTKFIFSVADLHALTMPQEPENFKKARMQMLASMLAVGLDEERCTIFMQSEFGLVTELMWILSCTASLGYLSRMTQWKSKTGLKLSSSFEHSTRSTKTKLGLLSYPVLQAADILIHRTTHVPVGADQAQHLEFARECVTNFNSTYSPVFVKPETLLSPSRRIKSLTNQEVKMSKSSGSKNSRILITDTKEEIRAKILSAITDSDNRVSWDPENRPGVANLLTILSAFDTLGRTPDELAKIMEGMNLREFKNLLSQNVEENLLPIREQYNKLIADHDHLHKVAARGLEKAYTTGHQNLRLVKEAIGLC